MKQTNSFTKGGALSVTLSDIHMIRMEIHLVVPIRPTFYKWYVNDIYNRWHKNTFDKLFHRLNKQHHKVKLTIEINPLWFPDIEIFHNNSMIETREQGKKGKLPWLWKSNVPKRNTIKGYLHYKIIFCQEVALDV